MLGDWVPACLATDPFEHQRREAPARVVGLSDGHEVRQFLHVNDTARALVALMWHHEAVQEDLAAADAPGTLDVSSGQWVTLRHLAKVVEEASPSPCRISFVDTVRLAVVLYCLM